ncbi:unnamed protein product [Rotaria sp. Silwood1]|nr:unnamed protein product [Rotaria sp. Silwood1]CAF1519104.1 unnamed protein product [Rotaria sp. Silwood1]
MLNFAQQLFGSDTNKEFAMFDSFYEHPDLMFLNDATVQLTCITTSLDDYLSPDIIQLLHRTESQMCNIASYHFISYNFFFFLIFYLYK